MIETTPSTPLGPATSGLTLGRSRLWHAAGWLLASIAPVVAIAWVVFGPAIDALPPLMLVALGALAAWVWDGVFELGEAWLALRALRRCPGCRAAEVARAAADGELAACRRAYWRHRIGPHAERAR